MGVVGRADLAAMTRATPIAIAASLMAACSIAHASDWRVIHVPLKDFPAAVEVDFDSINVVGPLTQVWSRQTFKKRRPLAGDPSRTYLVTRMLTEFDCAARTFALLRVAFLAEAGDRQPISVDSGNEPLEPVEPDTAAELLFNTVCPKNAQVTVESVVATIVRNHNANTAAILDGFTIATSARAEGKRVIFNNVIRIQKGLAPSKLAEFQAGAYNDIAPKTCAIAANHLGFDRGMSYEFVFDNAYGERLADFVVDKNVCANETHH